MVRYGERMLRRVARLLDRGLRLRRFQLRIAAFGNPLHPCDGRTGTGRNQATDDHVLFEPAQVIGFAVNSRFCQHARRLLEGRRRDERTVLQGRFRDPLKHRLAAGGFETERGGFVFTSNSSSRSTISPMRKVVSPGFWISTFCSIWRTMSFDVFIVDRHTLETVNRLALR